MDHICKTSNSVDVQI
jgi:hypothetical protein